MGVPGHLHLQRRAQAAARRLLHLRALRSRHRHLRHVLGVRPAAPAAHPPPATSSRSRAAISTSPSRRRRRHQPLDDAARRRRRARAVHLRAHRWSAATPTGGACALDARRSTPRKPPMPVGGDEYGGVKTCMGQYGTHSYFQSDVRFRGTLEWGDVREEVDGDSGWIDRQWTPRHLGVHTDRRNTRYRHEWRQIHLDNGVEMSVWLHVDRQRGNRLIPFCGATAATPDGRVARHHASSTIERPELRARSRPSCAPRTPLTRGAQVLRRPLPPAHPGVGARRRSRSRSSPAPAHELPIEYWSGPTRVQGTHGRPAGARASASTSARSSFARDFELVDVLRETLRHLPRRRLSDRLTRPARARRPGLGGRRVPQPRRPRRRARASAHARAARRSSGSPSRIGATCCRSWTTSTRRCSADCCRSRHGGRRRCACGERR